MNTAFERMKKWREYENLPIELKNELVSIEGDTEKITLAFGDELSFGTAGLRGIMGVGDNRMNVLTVRRATQGLAEFILSEGGKTAVIACDTRINSELFAKETASVFAGNGIKAYIFDAPRPTPELSFAIRELKCKAGVNITASHNPKEYNGYKAYGEDGAQLGPEQADAVFGYMKKCDVFGGAKYTPFDEGVKDGSIVVIGGEVDEEYMKNVLAQRCDETLIPSLDLSVVYTPLHGAGRITVPEILRRAGVKNVYTVPEQMIPDGSFPTVKFPNPEFEEAFVSGKKIAEEKGCQLVIATDPDCDRMGIAIKTGENFTLLTGNQTGCLLLDYIIQSYKENGKLPDDAYAVKSIVSTELASDICRANGVKMYDVLTGFKFIGEVIKQHEKSGKGTFLLGFEESYGSLKGTYARDKDAAVASLLVTEMMAFYMKKGMTLKDAVDGLYEKYGFYREKVRGISFPGADGKSKMEAFTANLRENPLAEIIGEKVVSVRDYKTGIIKDTVSGKEEETGLPSSDVLYYKTENVTFVVRPSGTEPKVKLYYMVKGKDETECEKRLSDLEDYVAQTICK